MRSVKNNQIWGDRIFSNLIFMLSGHKVSSDSAKCSSWGCKEELMIFERWGIVKNCVRDRKREKEAVFFPQGSVPLTLTMWCRRLQATAHCPLLAHAGKLKTQKWSILSLVVNSVSCLSVFRLSQSHQLCHQTGSNVEASFANAGGSHLSISTCIASFLKIICFFAPGTREILIMNLEQQVQFKSVGFKSKKFGFFFSAVLKLQRRESLQFVVCRPPLTGKQSRKWLPGVVKTAEENKEEQKEEKAEMKNRY